MNIYDYFKTTIVKTKKTQKNKTKQNKKKQKNKKKTKPTKKKKKLKQKKTNTYIKECTKYVFNATRKNTQRVFKTSGQSSFKNTYVNL